MSMSDNHSHHHHHHKEDYGSRFKRQSLSSIAFRRSADKWMKIILFALSYEDTESDNSPHRIMSYGYDHRIPFSLISNIISVPLKWDTNDLHIY